MKGIYEIFFIAGDPDTDDRVRTTGRLSRETAISQWETLIKNNGEDWRCWLVKDGKRVSESERETRWQNESEN